MAKALIPAPRLCISSTSGGGGKTLLSLGLARAFTNEGIPVKPFKKGPDYIDSAWLSAACGRDCANLDLFFLNPEALERLFADSMSFCPQCLAIIEGNRGLYDGLDETGACSTAQVARAVHAPILLCLDCVKATRTMAAIIRGLTSFEANLTFAGVVLNRVGSSRHETSLRRALEANTNLPVLGAIPRMDKNLLPERHMGLVFRGVPLQAELDHIFDALARMAHECCDLRAIMAAAQQAPPIAVTPPPVAADIKYRQQHNRPIIGYVHDEALWFYYPENLQALQDAGCELRALSLFDRESDWQGLHGLYLGGGFPEEHAREISRAPQMQILRQLAMDDLPIYAECGGLIILCRGLAHKDKLWPMADIVPAIARWSSRPVGLGYVSGEIVEQNAFYPLGTAIRGHEFHYCSCIFDDPPPALALRLDRGCGLWAGNGHYDGYVNGNLWASFTHIFAPAMPLWARNFGRLCLERKG